MLVLVMEKEAWPLNFSPNEREGDVACISIRPLCNLFL